MDQKRNTIQLKREPVIGVPQPMLVDRLCKYLQSSDQERFKRLCEHFQAYFRDYYNRESFDNLKSWHAYFDPNSKHINNFEVDKPPEEREALLNKMEQDFLAAFKLIMEKSNFKMLSKNEWEIAKSSKYVLNLRVRVDESRLDDRLLSEFYGNNEMFNKRLVVYRRGIGIDNAKGMFFMAKLVELRKSFWNMISTLCVGKDRSKSSGRRDEENDWEDAMVDAIERVHVEDVKIKSFFQKVELQEPTFQQIIVLYRRKTKPNCPRDRAIHIKHFKDVPMADMEIILPETKTPRLSKWEWFKLIVSLVAGVVGFWEAYQRNHRNHVAVAFAFLVAFISYAFKVYFTFHTNVLEYHKLMSKAVYNKQMDSHGGTLLHLCDFVIQQEVKEAIVAYFVLLTDAKATTMAALSRACNKLLEREFKEKCAFETQDAIDKLVKLNLVTLENEVHPLPDFLSLIRHLVDLLNSCRNLNAGLWKMHWSKLARSNEKR